MLKNIPFLKNTHSLVINIFNTSLETYSSTGYFNNIFIFCVAWPIFMKIKIHKVNKKDKKIGRKNNIPFLHSNEIISDPPPPPPFLTTTTKKE